MVYLGCALLHLLELVYRPPTRYPDLFPVLNVLLSTPVFLFTFIWSIKSIIQARWAVGGLTLCEPKEGPSTASPIENPSCVSTALAPPDNAQHRREGGLRVESLVYAAGKRQADMSIVKFPSSTSTSTSN